MSSKDSTGTSSHLISLPRDSTRLEELGTPITVPKGSELVEPNVIPEYCYLVKSGRVACYEFSYSGEQRIYNLMIPVSLFLEECVLYRQPCPVRFRTIEETELIKIDRCSLIRAFKSDIDIVMDICESLSMKFLSSMEHLRLGPHQSAAWKVCNMLLIYARQYGVSYDSKILIKEKINQQFMADILGLNRITVTRKLKELKDMALIENINGYYCIRDIHQLETHMTCMETL